MNEWTEQEKQQLRLLYPTCADVKDLVKVFNRSYKAIKSKAKIMHLHRKKHTGSVWDDGLRAKLKQLYPDKLNVEIASLLGLTAGQVATEAHKLGLLKTREFMRMHASKTAFKKGITPVNKGKKQSEYMSTEAIARTIATRFKKGQIPKNAIGIKDGDITIRVGSAKRGSIPHKHIRLEKGKWQELQIYNYEKIYGTVPKGFVLACKDGNTLNCDPSNWYPLSLKENMKRNSASKNLSDGYIAFTIVGKNNMHLFEEVLKDKKLLEVKRQQILLNRTINEHTATAG